MAGKEKPVKRSVSGKFSIPSRQKNVEIDLMDNDPELFEVLEKEIATNLPKKYGETSIIWIAAFGIRHKDKTTKALGDYANIKYKVHMDALPADKRIFAYYNDQVNEITKFETSGGKTRFDLEIGDPPIGFGP